MKLTFAVLTGSVVLLGGCLTAEAINIVVDYTYDSNNFFDTQQKKDAMQAAADRFSAVIAGSLRAVAPGDSVAGWRIGFDHPGTGALFQISTAASFATDPLSGAGAAGVYGFGGLIADRWTLFAGGRALSSAGVGGTATGTNFTTVFDDINGPMHRGYNDNTPANSTNDLPRWGGAIAFNTGTTWHFGLGTTAPGGAVDFYSIALHEVGHALGLSTSWNQWQDNNAGLYTGPAAVAAYNADNGTALITLDEVSAANEHWKDNAYDSFIFSAGSPNTVGTVPNGTRQDLLMEPIASFGGLQSRFELTNVDVAALSDLGWTVIPEPSGIVFSLIGLALVTARRRR